MAGPAPLHRKLLRARPVRHQGHGAGRGATGVEEVVQAIVGYGSGYGIAHDVLRAWVVTLTLDDVEFMKDESAVFDLGVLPARAYDDPSAAATASPGP